MLTTLKSTTTDIYSTTIVTEEAHTTVVVTASTVTITPTPMSKRADSLDVTEILQGFRREKQALNVTVIDTPQMSASFSSACDCQTYGGSTVVATLTNSAQVSAVQRASSPYHF